MGKVLPLLIFIIKERYLLRSFLVGCMMFAIYIHMNFIAGLPVNIYTISGLMTTSWGGAALIFFPFSKYFCDNLIDFILGGNIFFIPVLFSLLIKLIINFNLFLVAPIIGPLVLLYFAITPDND